MKSDYGKFLKKYKKICHKYNIIVIRGHDDHELMIKATDLRVSEHITDIIDTMNMVDTIVASQ